MTKRNQKNANRSAKITAAAPKAAFATPKVADSLTSFDTDGQFRMLEIARQIKRQAGKLDDAGDQFWRLADEAERIIEARK